MLYTGRDQDTRTGDPARSNSQERRTFARRIDCDSSSRRGMQAAPARGGAPRESGAWEHARTAYGR